MGGAGVSPAGDELDFKIKTPRASTDVARGEKLSFLDT